MSTVTVPEARMTNVAQLVPDAYRALVALSASAKDLGVPRSTALFVQLRASQINGCAFCVDMHARELRDTGEPDERIWGVAAWRESPHFTAAERAALALTEATTRVADTPEPVSDEVWAQAADHYDERGLAGLLIEIGSINVWNRFNAATRQPAASA
jgi:AhpD family alkylhydroperoxidase